MNSHTVFGLFQTSTIIRTRASDTTVRKKKKYPFQMFVSASLTNEWLVPLCTCGLHWPLFGTCSLKNFSICRFFFSFFFFFCVVNFSCSPHQFNFLMFVCVTAVLSSQQSRRQSWFLFRRRSIPQLLVHVPQKIWLVAGQTGVEVEEPPQSLFEWERITV